VSANKVDVCLWQALLSFFRHRVWLLSLLITGKSSCFIGFLFYLPDIDEGVSGSRLNEVKDLLIGANGTVGASYSARGLAEVETAAIVLRQVHAAHRGHRGPSGNVPADTPASTLIVPVCGHASPWSIVHRLAH